jgi:hypothetical protein
MGSSDAKLSVPTRGDEEDSRLGPRKLPGGLDAGTESRARVVKGDQERDRGEHSQR